MSVGLWGLGYLFEGGVGSIPLRPLPPVALLMAWVALVCAPVICRVYLPWVFLFAKSPAFVSPFLILSGFFFT
ncbi:hypothetical protein AC792_08655 [Arthrobacter sp. RIT-PI-e]|nr:hypothetical protein AC792_08655 [Arthrobacter sp. RIT-PI-e]